VVRRRAAVTTFGRISARCVTAVGIGAARDAVVHGVRRRATGSQTCHEIVRQLPSGRPACPKVVSSNATARFGSWSSPGRFRPVGRDPVPAAVATRTRATFAMRSPPG